MADVTYYLALPFGAGDDGPEPREAIECTSANTAIRSVERMARAEGTVRWHAAVQAILPAENLRMRLF